MADDQKRWRQFTLTNEEAWRANENSLEALSIRVTEAKEYAERHEEHIAYLSKMLQTILNSTLEHLQTLREQAEDGRGSLPAAKIT